MSLRLIPPRKGKSPYWRMLGTYLDRRIDKTTRARTREEAERVKMELEAQIAAGDGLVWRQIPGFSRYEISDNGQVRRLPAILKQTRQPSGHLAVTIYSDDGKQWRVGAHRLVAMAFNGEPPPGKPYACHKNGVADQNTKENLYWGSAADNAADAVRHASPWFYGVRKGESGDSKHSRYRRRRKIVIQQDVTEQSQ